MPSREIDFSFENAQEVLQMAPLRAISSALWSRGQKMSNQDKMAPLLRPLGIILKGASRGVTTYSDTAIWQSSIAAVALGFGSIFVAITQVPGILAGVGLVAATVVSSAIVAPYAASLIAATALSLASIPKAIINLPQSFKDAARARKMAAPKPFPKPPKETPIIIAPAPPPPTLTLFEAFEKNTPEIQTKFVDDLAAKFPHHFAAAVQKIADRDAGMQGVLTTPAKLMAKPIQIVRKDTTSP